MLTFDQAGNKQDSSYKVVPWFISTRGYGFHLDSIRGKLVRHARRRGRTAMSCRICSPALKFNVVYGPKLTDVLTRYTGYTGRPLSAAALGVWHRGFRPTSGAPAVKCATP